MTDEQIPRIDEILTKSLQQVAESPDKQRMQWNVSYHAAVGPIIAQHSHVVAVAENNLVIGVWELEWYFMLERIKRRILERCRRIPLFERAVEMILTLESSPPDHPSPEPVSSWQPDRDFPKLSEQENQDIIALTSQLDDPALRWTVRRVMRLHYRLAKQREDLDAHEKVSGSTVQFADSDRHEEQFDAIALCSGGLDSLLAVKLLVDQGVSLLALHLTHVFQQKQAAETARLLKTLDELGVPTVVQDVTKDLVALVKQPQHGLGKLMNPCIDCRIMSLTKAYELMNKVRARFIVTGEVLGQRPMSQRAGVISLIDVQTGLGDIILRPLSAQLLKPTAPERSGLVAREKLLAIKGRSRKIQLKLAEQLNVRDYQSPAGGCLLTDPGYTHRYLLFKKDAGQVTPTQFGLLKHGRHLRISSQIWLIIGRDERENALLEDLAFPGDLLFTPESVPGASGLLLRHDNQMVISRDELAVFAGMVLRYSKATRTQQSEVRIRYIGTNDFAIMTIQPSEDVTINQYLVTQTVPFECHESEA